MSKIDIMYKATNFGSSRVTNAAYGVIFTLGLDLVVVESESTQRHQIWYYPLFGPMIGSKLPSSDRVG